MSASAVARAVALAGPRARAGLADREIARCLAGNFLLRAAAAAAAAVIAFYLADGVGGRPGGRAGLVLGLATLLFFVAEVVGALAFGALADRHGERRYLLLGPVFGLVAATTMAVAAAVPVVVLARLLQGLSTAASVPTTLALLSRRCGEDEGRRGRVMSAFEVAAIAGMAAGFVGAGAAWDRLGTGALYGVAGLYVASLALLWPVGRGAAPVRPTGRSVAAAVRAPGVLRLVPAWVAVNAVLGVWLTHAALQLKRADDPAQLLVGGFTGRQISLYGAVTMLLFVGGIVVWGLALGRVGSLRTMVLALLGLGALVPALYALNRARPGDPIGVAIPLALAGLALVVASGFTPAALAYLAGIAEEHAADRGAIMGLYSVLLGVGQALGAVAGGFAADWRGAEGLIALSGAFFAVAAAALWALARAARRRPGQARASAPASPSSAGTARR